MCAKPAYLIAGNWKMNKGPAEAAELAKAIREAVGEPGCGVVACPPYVSLPAVIDVLRGSPVAVGAQNCHWAESGAFTGEVAPAMLTEMGVGYVILGHSERRALFGETDEGVNKRMKGALAAGLRPIVCVGETLEEREGGVTERVLGGQLDAGFAGITAEQLKRVVIAYEPVWAIGTGKTATDTQAEETCAFIRGHMAGLYGGEAAGALQILYGGSMNAGNAAGLLGCPNINGGLIGGAALKSAEFAAIVEAACRAGV